MQSSNRAGSRALPDNDLPIAPAQAKRERGRRRAIFWQERYGDGPSISGDQLAYPPSDQRGSGVGLIVVASIWLSLYAVGVVQSLALDSSNRATALSAPPTVQSSR